jgi:GNAT superfamily N-acetyltransferase
MTAEPSTATGITIRAATPEDVPSLVAMVNAAYRKSEGHVFPGTTRVQRTDAMQRLDGTLVSIVDGAVAGCVRCELGGHDCTVPEQATSDARVAHFGLLSTDISLQGRGIASALVEHVEQLARDAGCTVMRIEVVKEGGRVPFYERRGYRVTAETDGQTWNGGKDWGAAGPWHMVDMEKPL